MKNASEASLLASLARETALTIFCTTSEIRTEFDCVVSARERISAATTPNPFPASPACADSIAAFIARRFVLFATELMIVTTFFTSSSLLLMSFKRFFVAEIF